MHPCRQQLVLSCEHAGRGVPPEYASLFDPHRALLARHRGWDPGALELARSFAEASGAPLFATTVTRLLVEANRSRGNPALFSSLMLEVEGEEKERIARRYHDSYWDRVAQDVQRVIDRHGLALHLSVHTFTPKLDDEDERPVEVGLLYDPARDGETVFAQRWERKIRARRPDLRVLHNYPYSGTADGLVTSLRELLRGDCYIGLEIEVNQAFALGQRPGWAGVKQDLAESLVALL